MIKAYIFTICIFLGGLLFKAQAPCSDFDSPTLPAGNWVHAPYPNGNVTISSGTPNTLDGSQFLKLIDDSGGSRLVNTIDFKNLGQQFPGKCLFFDFYLENDGTFNGSPPIHPAIHIMSGSKIITFVANITVTEGSGWVRVRAPIANCSGSVLPSNSEGTWTMDPSSGTTCTDFNNIINNSTAVMITPDYTANPSEIVWYDNICVKPCADCDPNFKLDTSFSSTSNTATAKVSLDSYNPPNNYSVNWGDGTPITDHMTPHTYNTPGSYTVCVTQSDSRGLKKCSTCITFCYSKKVILKETDNTGLRSEGPDLEAISKEELQANRKRDISLVPNPAKNYVDVQTSLSKKDKVAVKIIDGSGKTVLEKSENLNSGRQSIRLNIEKLIQGIYIMELTSEGKTGSQKLMISK